VVQEGGDFWPRLAEGEQKRFAVFLTHTLDEQHHQVQTHAHLGFLLGNLS